MRLELNMIQEKITKIIQGQKEKESGNLPLISVPNGSETHLL